MQKSKFICIFTKQPAVS